MEALEQGQSLQQSPGAPSSGCIWRAGNVHLVFLQEWIRAIVAIRRLPGVAALHPAPPPAVALPPGVGLPRGAAGSRVASTAALLVQPVDNRAAGSVRGWLCRRIIRGFGGNCCVVCFII